MLVILDDSLCGLGCNPGVSAISALENLLNARFEGSHVVHASRLLLRCLSNIHDLSARGQAAVKYINQGYARRQGLLDRLRLRVRVVLEGKGCGWQGGEWIIPLEEFISSTLALPSIAVVENLEDWDVLKYAIAHFAIWARLRNVETRFRVRHGGGSTTAQCYDRVVSEREGLCFCIVDSDRFAPGASLGDTATEVEGVADRCSWITEAIILDQRELENLIPQHVIKEVQREDGFDRYEELLVVYERVGSEIVHYSDLKKGTSFEWVLELADEVVRQWWTKAAGQIIGERACFSQGQCLRGGACCCMISPALGERFARKCLRWLEGRSKHKSLEAVHGFNSCEWLGMGERLFSWVCAERCIRV